MHWTSEREGQNVVTAIWKLKTVGSNKINDFCLVSSLKVQSDGKEELTQLRTTQQIQIEKDIWLPSPIIFRDVYPQLI